MKRGSKSGLLIVAGLLFSMIAVFPLWSENYLHHRIRATILVADPDKAADEIAAWAEAAGGYYLLKSSDEVLIRFPYQAMGELRKTLEKIAEDVIEISPEAFDLREDILGLESGIRSREEILKKNTSYISEADVEGTLAIEQEIIKLLSEVESLKGKLRKLNVDRLYSIGRVSLKFMEQSIPEDIPSSFAWINTVDFYRFMQGGYQK